MLIVRPDAPSISIHPPHAGWDAALILGRRHMRLISIHPPHAGWDCLANFAMLPSRISIHPPHAGWDRILSLTDTETSSFQSTHPTRGGTRKRAAFVWRRGFQSTHPTRGGTFTVAEKKALDDDFNPPTPRGVGHGLLGLCPCYVYISIHPPHAGWDSKNSQTWVWNFCESRAIAAIIVFIRRKIFFSSISSSWIFTISHSIFWCEHPAVFLFAPTSHHQIIRTSSGS